jgi:hypothetical protein
MTYYETLLEKHGIVLDSATRQARLALRLEERQLIRSATTTARHPNVDPVTGYRICTYCHEAKPADAYSPNRQHYDGCDSRCRACKRTLAANYRKK